MPGLALALSVWLRAASIALLSLVLLVVTSASASAVQVSPSKWNSAPDYISAKGHPHSAGLNWYAYCGGDPVNRMDPSGLDWVDYRSDGSVYLVPEMDDTWGTDTDTRYRIGTLSQSMPGFIDLDPSFVSAGGSRLVSRELLDQHADDNNTGSMGSGTQWAVVRGYVRRAAVGQYAHNVFWDTLGDDVNAALARGSNGAQRAVQGTATAIGSIALAVPSGGTTSLTLSVGVDQTWAGMQDIWNASDPNAVPVSTHLANLIGEKPATYVEVVSGLVTSPGLGPKVPPGPRVVPGPFAPPPPATIIRDLRAGDLGLPQIATNRSLEVLFKVQRGEATISIGTLQGAFSGNAISTVRTVIDKAVQLARQSGAHSLRIEYVEAEPLITRIVQRLGYVVEQVPAGIVDELAQTKSFIVPLR